MKLPQYRLLKISQKDHTTLEAEWMDIVTCKDCKWWIDNLTENDDDEAYDSCRWDWSRKIPTADDFCSYGERTEQTEPQTDCAWK